MNNVNNRRCAWRLCLCGECPRTPRVIRVRTRAGVEMEPQEWARQYEAGYVRYEMGVAA